MSVRPFVVLIHSVSPTAVSTVIESESSPSIPFKRSQRERSGDSTLSPGAPGSDPQASRAIERQGGGAVACQTVGLAYDRREVSGRRREAEQTTLERGAPQSVSPSPSRSL